MIVVSAAGVDTWSPTWSIDPESKVFQQFRDRCVVASKHGGRLLPEPVDGHRVGCYGHGLIYAEGHPAGGGDVERAADELAAASGLLERAWLLQDRLQDAEVPVPEWNERYGKGPFYSVGHGGGGFAGFRRCDATVNLVADRPSEGIALLSGIAAIVRDSPGHAEVRYGLDHRAETVYVRGYAGKRITGRWYDKALESSVGVRGTMIRGEDQRRWGAAQRRDLSELSAPVLRANFHRRFYPLFQVTKGVTVGGAVVVAEKLLEAVEAKTISPVMANAVAGHTLMRLAGGRRGSGVSQSAMYKYERTLRELGLVLADGILEEVEVDIGAVLEAALDSDAWGRDG
jgi:hypothetical protein